MEKCHFVSGGMDPLDNDEASLESCACPLHHAQIGLWSF